MSEPTPTTLVTMLLDKSGSMNSVRAATIEAFNGYISTLKTGDQAIDFNFIQFDSVSMDKIHVRKPIAEVSEMTEADFVPRGGTPLIDAAYTTIKAVEASLPNYDVEPKIIICIQTDGQENQSTHHTWADLKELIGEKTALGWQFNFMGAGINAYEQSRSMGLSDTQTMSYSMDKGSTRAAFAAAGASSLRYASGAEATTAFLAAERKAAGDKYVDPTIGTVPASPLPTGAAGTPTPRYGRMRFPYNGGFNPAAPALDLSAPAATPARRYEAPKEQDLVL